MALNSILSPTIFLSYCYKNKDIAKEIDKYFLSIGTRLKIDERELSYKDSLSKYMKEIRYTTYAIILISDDFLKSLNCMYEINQLLKDDEYKDRILPILLPPLDIFTCDGILRYVDYWDEKEKEYENKLAEKDPLKIIKLREEQKKVHDISHEVGEFLTTIRDMKCKIYEEIKNEDYKDILEITGIEDKQIGIEISKISKIEDKEEKELALEALLGNSPKNKILMFYRAYIYDEKGEFKKSKKYYEELMDIYPDFSQVHNNLGSLLYNHFGEYQKAKNLFEKAIELDSSNIEAYINLGILSSNQLKDYDKAKECCDKAFELDSENANVYIILGNIFCNKLRNYDKAKKIWGKALKLDSTNALAYNNLGNLFILQSIDYDNARKYYEKAIEFDPNLAEAYYNLGCVLDNYHQEHDKAKEYIKKAFELNPNLLKDKKI